jgi:hypothetical protein
VGGEHLSGDLGVAGLVCSYEAEAIATEDGDKAVEQKEAADQEQDEEFACGNGAG